MSILSPARVDRFEVSLVYGKRAPWFNTKITTCFDTGGILSEYRRCGVVSLRKKFSETESNNFFYNTRSHQGNESTQNEGLPLFASIFFQYFDFMQTRELSQKHILQEKGISS